MKDTVYLTFDRNGVTGMRKGKPKLSAGEYATELRITVPDEYFNRAFPLVNISIPESAIVTPEADVEVVDVE